MLTATKLGSIADSLSAVLSSRDSVQVHANIVVRGRFARRRAAALAEIISEATKEDFLLENTTVRANGSEGDFYSESFTVGWFEEE